MWTRGHRIATNIAVALRQNGVRAQVLPAPSAGIDGYWVILVGTDASVVKRGDVLRPVRRLLREARRTGVSYDWRYGTTDTTTVSRPYIAVFRKESQAVGHRSGR